MTKHKLFFKFFILISISLYTSCDNNLDTEYYSNSFNEINKKDSSNLSQVEKTLNLDSLNKLSNENLKFDSYIRYGTKLYKNKRFNEALIVINNSIQYSENRKDLALCYSMIGLIYGNLNEVFFADEFYNKALDLYYKDNDKTNLIAILNNLGILFNNVGDFETSLSYYKKCYKIIHVSKGINYKEKYKFLMNFANVKFNLKDYEGASNLYIQALDISNDNNIKNSLRTKIRIAEINSLIGENDLALKQYKQLYDKFKLSNNYYDACNTSIELGKLLFAKKDFDKSLYYFSYSENTALKHNLAKEINISRYFIAKVHMLEKQYYLSLDFFKKVVDDKISVDEELRVNSLFYLYEIYKKSNNTNLALLSFEKYNKLKIKLIESHNKYNEDRTSLQYQLKKKKYEVESLKSESSYFQLLSLEQSQRINKLIISVVLIILLLSITYFFYSRNKLMKNELAEKNKALIIKNDQVISGRNELIEINNIKSQLLEVIAHDVKTPITDLYNFLFIIRHNFANMPKDQLFENLSLIESNISNLLNLLNNVLNWTLSNSKGFNVKNSSFNVLKLIESNLKLIESSVLSKSITVDKTYDFKEINIDTDYNIIDFSIRNILSNAVKYTKENGTIVISIIKNGKDSIDIIISDTGVGMNESAVDFLESDNKRITSRLGLNNEKGYGIGLYMCKEMLGLINSKLYYRKNTPTGSTFIIKVIL